MVPALVKAGLPPASIAPLIGALAKGDTADAAKLPGVTRVILGVAATSFRAAYAESFKVVYLATIAFGALSFIASFFIPNIDDKLTDVVIRRLGTQRSPESQEKVALDAEAQS